MVSILRYCLGNWLYTVLAENQSLKFFVSCTSLDALRCVSQMPVVLIPIHFDRDPEQRPVLPSCQRSAVIRTFITSDFMTGIPATPGKHLPLNVRLPAAVSDPSNSRKQTTFPVFEGSQTS